jgi:hypothetical protein
MAITQSSRLSNPTIHAKNSFAGCVGFGNGGHARARFSTQRLKIHRALLAILHTDAELNIQKP